MSVITEQTLTGDVMHRIPLRIIICLTAGLIISGCQTSNIKTDFELNSLSGTGLVIGSVTQDDERGAHDAYTIFYFHPEQEGARSEMIMSREKVLGGLMPGFIQSEFPGVKGRLFVIELKEGRYKFSSWQVNNGTGARIYPREAPPALDFEVSSGQILYVGNLHMHLSTGRNLFGIEITGDAVPEITDKSERDIAKFKEKYPKFKDNDIRLGQLKLGPWYTAQKQEQAKESELLPTVSAE